MGFEVNRGKNSYDLLHIKSEVFTKLGLKDEKKVLVTFKTDDESFKTRAYLTITNKNQLSLRAYGSNIISKYYKQEDSKQIYCEIKKGNFESDFVEYYLCLKNLICKHRYFGYGKSTRLSEGFTESLCRYKLGLYTIKDRQYDAIDSNEKLIEIKSTYDNIGTTTISTKAEFDYLLWMAFNIERDEISIYKISYNTLKPEIKSKVTRDRITITLSKFVTDINNPYKKIKFDLINKSIKEV